MLVAEASYRLPVYSSRKLDSIDSSTVAYLAAKPPCPLPCEVSRPELRFSCREAAAARDCRPTPRENSGRIPFCNMTANHPDIDDAYSYFGVAGGTATICIREAASPTVPDQWFGTVQHIDQCLAALESVDDLQCLIFYLGPGTGPARSTDPKKSEPENFSSAPGQQLAPPPSSLSGEKIATMLRRLLCLPCPTIAAIHGVCTGILADLATWCDYRIATQQIGTTIEYPYSRLELVSPLAADIRLAQIVGPATAAYLVATGQPIAVRSAARIGLVNRLVATAAQLETAALESVATASQRAALLDTRNRLFRPTPEAESTWETVEHHLPQLLIASDHPAPESARRAIAHLKQNTDASTNSILTELERRASSARTLPVQPPLQHVHHLLQQTYDSFRTLDGTEPESLSLGICGAGIMGRGIAAAALAHGIPTVLYDADHSALDTARATIRADFAAEQTLPWSAVLAPADAAQHLVTVESAPKLKGCGLIVESIVENHKLKQQILKRLETISGGETILASNTSTIPITQLAAELDHPDHFCGLHFCNPVRQRQLVEVVRGAETSPETLCIAINYARAMGKVPIVTRDHPGFVVNRLLVVYLNEAIIMLCEGVPLTTIDHAARTFGMPLGPFELLDLIGTDTAMMAGRSLWDAFPDRVSVTPVLPALVKRNRLGWKTRLGFYRYQQIPGPAQEDEQLTEILEPYIRRRSGAPTTSDPQQIITRLLLPMTLEATRLLDDGVVETPREIDLGVIFGLAFPARRGGLCYWADQLGPRHIVSQLRHYETLGTRMAPTPRLLQMATEQTGFYPSFRH